MIPMGKDVFSVAFLLTVWSKFCQIGGKNPSWFDWLFISGLLTGYCILSTSLAMGIQVAGEAFTEHSGDRLPGKWVQLFSRWEYTLGLNKPWSLWVVHSFAHRINKGISPVSSHMSSITLSNLHSLPMLARRYQSWQWEPMLLEQEVQLSISCDNHEVYMARASRTLDNHEVCTASELLQWAHFETSAACENSAYFPTRTDQKSNHLYFIRENPIEILDTNQVINNQLTDDHNKNSAMLMLDSCEKAWVTLQPIQLCNVLEQWKGNHKTKCDAHHPKKVLPSGSFDKILLASVSTLFCKSLKQFNISSIWFFTERCQIS